MNIALPFIRRPIGTTLMAIGLFLVGVAAYIDLPVASLPSIDFPTIMVSASRPGASPEIMASTVAAPLERRLGEISGVTELTSTSSLGSTSIVVQFDMSRNIDGAARDVQAAINAALSRSAERSADGADVPQGQPGRRAGADPGADLANAGAERDLRHRRHGRRPAHLADRRRRRRQRERRRAAGDPRPRQPGPPRQHGPVDRGRPRRHRRGQCHGAGRHLRRRRRCPRPSAPTTSCATPVDYKSLVVKTSDGAVVRLGDIASIEAGTRNTRSAALVQRAARRAADHHQAGRCQRHRDRRQVQALVPELQTLDSGRHRDHGAVRPHARPSARACTTCSSRWR